jgi:hypothetical protein
MPPILMPKLLVLFLGSVKVVFGLVAGLIVILTKMYEDDEPKKSKPLREGLCQHGR